MKEITRLFDPEVCAEKADSNRYYIETFWDDLRSFGKNVSMAFFLMLALENFSSIEAQAQAQPQVQKAGQPGLVTVETSIDSQGMYEAWLRFKNKNGWLFVNQNHAEQNTKLDFSYFGVGKDNLINNSVKLSGNIGPQFDLNKQKLSHIGGFGNVSVKLGKAQLNSVNRIAVPLEDSYALVHRHMQNLSNLSFTPKDFSLQFEQRHITGKRWDENKIGAVYEFDLPGGRGKAYVYADVAAKGFGFRFVFSARVK